MHRLGMPVPPAFVLTTAVGKRCAGGLPDDVWADVLAALARLEAATGRRFGEELLVSVRSGAAQSMPGMMDTILNLGITDAVEAALAAASGDAAFARDTHRRFRESYARLVGHGRPRPTRTSSCAPRSARCSRRGARRAPWPTATTSGMSHDGGTAVTVQAMVYGNLDDRSGTGVLFTRDPQSGDPAPMGEFLPRGQGEDVVSGEVDPLDLADLAQRLPEVHAALLDAGRALERHARDVQDIEFTVERGRLYLLQTRVAKRSARAALQLAADFVDEGVLTPAEALARIRPEHVTTVLRPVLDPEARAAATVLARGEPACPGIGSGRAVADPDEAAFAGDDEDVVLVRHATSPEDVHGMIAARAVCTEVRRAHQPRRGGEPRAGLPGGRRLRGGDARRGRGPHRHRRRHGGGDPRRHRARPHAGAVGGPGAGAARGVGEGASRRRRRGPPAGGAVIELVDQTFRDGQQSLWGMRLRGGMLRKVAGELDRSGFRAVEVTGSSLMECSVRYSREDPWESLDLWRTWLPSSELRSPVCQNRIGTFGMTPDALMDLWVQNPCAPWDRRAVGLRLPLQHGPDAPALRRDRRDGREGARRDHVRDQPRAHRRVVRAAGAADGVVAVGERDLRRGRAGHPHAGTGPHADPGAPGGGRGQARRVALPQQHRRWARSTT